MTYLALKHKAPGGVWRALFHYITKARLLTEYPHAGIVKDGMLMHTTLTNGLHAVAFDPDGWHLFKLPDGIDPDALFAQLMDTPYDWFSLLAFALPWRVSDSRAMYCYVWCWRVMTGENPSFMVTPEKLLVKLAEIHGNKNEHR